MSKPIISGIGDAIFAVRSLSDIDLSELENDAVLRYDESSNTWVAVLLDSYENNVSALKTPGTPSLGVLNTLVRADHIHPAQTSVSGNAGTATKLYTARTIGISGGATGTATSFNGSANITIPVTSLDASKLTGLVPIESIPPASIERMMIVVDDDARFALTSDDVQIGDTVKVNSTGLMYFVVDDTQLSTAAGYEIYTAGSASSVPWSGVTDKPTEFNPINHASSATTYGVSSATNYGHAMASSTTPLVAGTATVGTETTKFARGNHVHPAQTSVTGSSGSCTGNAATATKLATARTVGISGGATGTATSFDGLTNISIPVTSLDESALSSPVAIARGGTGATTAAGALTNLGITATATELNYTDGVTSSIQNQIDSKAPINHASATTAYGISSDTEYGHAMASDTTPLVAGIASAGSETDKFAMGDHIHPVQTSVSGNAGTATTLETERTIALSGGATGTATGFDGSINISIPVTALDESKLSSPVAIARGGTGATTAATALTNLGLTATATELNYSNGVTSNLQTQINGKAPTSHASAATTYGIASNTLYGHAMASSTTPIVAGSVSVGTETAKFARGDHVHPAQTSVTGSSGSCTGNSSTATTLATARTIALSGGATGTATSFNGSANITIPVTSLDATKLTGLVPIESIPPASVERMYVVADDTARFSLTSGEVQNGDTVKVNSTGLMYFVVDDTQLSTEFGYETYTAGSASSVPWSGVTDKPSTFTPSLHASTSTTYGVSSATNYGHAMASSATPLVAGTASVGAETAKFARGDHVHPVQTSVSGSSGSCTGNSSTATTLATARTIALSGGATGTATSFNGSANISIPVTSLDESKLSSAVAVARGGTGATTASGALTNLGLTATATELNYTDGVTSNIQTQLNAKAPTSHATSATTYGVSSATNYGHAMASSVTPLMNGVATLGSETSKFARGNHIHPSDDSKQDVLIAGNNITIAENVISAGVNVPSTGETQTYYVVSGGETPVISTDRSDLPEIPVSIPVALTSTEISTVNFSIVVGPSGILVSPTALYNASIYLTSLVNNSEYNFEIQLVHIRDTVTTPVAKGIYSYVGNTVSDVYITIPMNITYLSDNLEAIEGDIFTVYVNINRLSNAPDDTIYITSSASTPTTITRNGGGTSTTSVYESYNGEIITQQEINNLFRLEDDSKVDISQSLPNGILITDSESDVNVISQNTGFNKSLSNALPLVSGIASSGTSENISREDHIHPLQINVSGNAGTATTLETSRNISISGGATGTATAFDGSDDITIPVTSLDESKLSSAVAVVRGGTGATTAAGALVNFGLSATSTELNYTDGVTSNIQTQLNGKAPTSHASTATTYGVSSATNYGHAMASSVTPLVAGTVAVGTDDGKFARGDHVHPVQTSVSGNAGTATTLATARTIALSGGATGTATSFDGSANITIPITALDESKLSSAVAIARGGTGATTAVGALTNLGLTATATELNYTDGVTSNIQTQLNGKAPTSHASTATTYGVSSATNYGHAMASNVTPLVAGTASVGTDDGKFARGNHVHPVQTSVSGNAGTATKLATSKTIALSGGATGTATAFDGSANISIPVTSLDATKLTGIIPIESIPPASIEKLTIVIDDTARFALTTTEVQNGDTVKVSSTGLMYFVVDDTQLNIEAGYEIYTVGSASSVPWSGITDKPSEFNPTSHATSATTYGISSSSNYGHAMASSVTPLVAGTATLGSETAKFARGDHVHPAQTSVSGNAGTATTLATARTIALSGGATGTATSFNGSANISIPVTSLDESKLSSAVAIARGGTGATTADDALINLGLTATATELNYTDGVTSSIQTQLNGKSATSHASTATTYGVSSATNYGHAMASSVTPLVAGTAAIGTETAKFARGDHVHPAQTSVSGNAGTATTLATARTIALSGGATGTATSFNGSANISIPVTSLDATKLTGLVPVDSIPLSVKEKLVVVDDDTARFALTISEVQNGDTVKVSSTGYMFFVIDDTQLSTSDGYEIYTVGTAATVDWSGITNKPTSFNPISHATTATTYGVSSATNYGHAMASSTTPVVAGTAAVGTETANFARGDHVHPAQTTITGNAGTATTLATARTIALSGGATGTATSFNGSANISIPVTALDESKLSSAVAIARGGTGATTAAGALTNLGLTATATELNYTDGVTSNIQTQLNGKSPTSHASTATTYGVSSATNYGHAMASSTTPLVAGTASVGTETAKFAMGDHVHPAQTTITGNAGTATTLATARTIALSGGATGTATSFNGSANISIPVTALDESKLSSAVAIARGGTGSTTAAGALTNLGLTATAAELNYTDGVTSNIQTQIDGKASINHASITDIYGLSSDTEYGHVMASSTTPIVAGTADLGLETANFARGDHVHPAQTTITGNAGTATTLATSRTIGISGGATGTATSFNGSANITIPVTSLDESKLSSAVAIARGGTGSTTAAGALTNLGLTATATELNYTDGVTSNIQTQLNAKAPTSHASTTTTYGVSSATNYGHAMASSTTPLVAGTADLGLETTSFARGDHVHPVQTSVSGNAGTATTLATARTIALSGGATGTATGFDGSANISIPVTALDESTLSSAVAIARGGTGATTAAGALTNLGLTATATELNYTDGVTSNIQTQLNAKAPTSHATSATTYGISSATNYGHAMASSATPLVAGTATIGSETAKFARGDHVHPAQTSVTGSSGSCTGNASTATTLATSRTIALSGGATGTATSFNGSANISIPVTALDATKLTGLIPISSIPPASIERMYVVVDDTARFALTTTEVQNGDTVKVTSTGLMYFVVDDTQLGVEAGYETYTAGSASSVPWSGVTDKPSTFTPSSHASTATTYGVSSATNYGHAMASSVTPLVAGTATVGAETAKFARGDHVHPAQTSVSGNAGTATTLATARTIALSGGATGTATSFNGSANITIPVTSLDESKLSSAVAIARGGTGATTAAGALTNLGLTATAAELNYTDGVTSNIQTQINSKAPISHASSATTYGISSSSNYGHAMASSATPLVAGTATIGTDDGKFARGDHVHPVQTSVTGNAGTATKLATARTISLTGNVTGSASFDGSTNASIAVDMPNIIPTTNVARTNLGYPSVLEAGTVRAEWNNKLWFIDPSRVSFETSSDDITYTPVSVSDSVIKALFAGNGSGSYSITKGDYLRITINGGSYVYLDALYLYISTNGGSAKLLIEKQLYDTTTWSIVSNWSNTFSTWPGHMYLPHTNIPFSNGTTASHAQKIRFTIRTYTGGEATTVSLHDIQWYGGYPATDGKGYIYSWDSSKNVTFPAALNVVDASTTRDNFGVPPTSHASSATTYGISSSSNYGHAMASSATPLVAGTASVGTDDGKFARGNHVHPVQTSVSGNAGTATTLATARTIALSGGAIGTATSFNGSSNISIPVTSLDESALSSAVAIARGGTGATTAAGALTNLGLTATATELNYVDGVTSSVQTQLNSKSPTSHATTATTYGVSSATNYGHAMASSTTPVVAGTASVGTETAKFARGDHAHPAQTTITGNAGTATTLATSRTIALSGGATGTATSFNGSANISIPVTALDESALSSAVAIARGGTGATTAAGALSNLGLTATATELNYTDGVTSSIQTQINSKAPTSHASSATTYGISSATNYGHAMASSTTPLVAGTATVGTETANFARGDHVHPVQTSVSGNAGTATKLATSRTISLTGDVTGSASFDGSANVSISSTVGNDSHNHTNTTLPVISSLNKTILTGNTTSATYYSIGKQIDNTKGFRCKLAVTVTSTVNSSIRHVLYADIVSEGLNYASMLVTSKPYSTTAATTGVYYIRSIVPKAYDNGYYGYIQVYSYDTTSRDYTIELLETDNFELLSSFEVSTYNSTYQSASDVNALYNGISTNRTIYASLSGNASSADYDHIAGFFKLGESITKYGLVMQAKDGYFYKPTTSGKTYDVNNTAVMCHTSSTVVANTNISGYSTYGISLSYTVSGTWTSLTDIYVRGSVSGSIFTSDGTITQTMENGYAYFKLGIMYSTTYIRIDANAHPVYVMSGGVARIYTTDSVNSATTATTLATARTIGISGGATGTATSFNGSASITIPVTALDESKLSSAVAIARGGTGSTTAAGALTNLGLTATAAELNYTDGVTSSIQTQLNGKSPTSHASTATTYGVSSATNYGHAMASSVTPLVAGTASVGTDDGKFARGNHVHPVQTSVTGSSGSCTGNASTATKLATARTIALSGGATGTATSFNGSANISIPVTALDATKLTGLVPISSIPPASIERMMIVADDTTRFALTTTDVQNGDTVKVTSTGLMYFVVDDTQLGVEAGYEIYTAGSASSVPWSGVTDKPSTFTPTSHATSATTYGVSSSSNYGHAMASSVTPLVAGTATLGSETAKFARGDHVHPAQTTITGNAGTATTLATARSIAISGGATGTATSFNGSANITIPVTSLDESKLSSAVAIARGGTGSTTAAGALTNLGLTATAAELNYTDGVTSNIQTQLNAKAPTSHASTATTYGISSSSNYGHAMASSTTPLVAGTASVGTETAKFAMGDHVHPAQTSVSGNAGTATTLATARTIAISGGATGTATSFNGSANITIPVTALDESKLSSAVAIARGGTGATTAAAALTNFGLTATVTELNYTDGVTSSIQTQLNAKAPTSHASTSTTYGVSSATNYGHAMASSTTPLVAGTAAVGTETANFARGNHVHPAQTSVTGSSGSCTGNAATATKLATARTITLTGDVTGSASFDGSANISITTTGGGGGGWGD